MVIMGGIKHDDGKNRWDLLPFDAVEKVVEIYTFGAAEYGENTWQNVEEERYWAALLRHICAARKGEKFDEKSKKLHIAHAAWNCLALIWIELNKTMEDQNGTESN